MALAVLKPTRREIRTARYNWAITDSTTASRRASVVIAGSPLEPRVVSAARLKYMRSVSLASLAASPLGPGETNIEPGKSKYIE